ncbi:MAG: DUF2971 domain-containing protein [Bacteroidales bacterium]|jgi:uncharacterized membrane protein|nr:DUF2971 domain-containing protein [Bacteroidales bacterium]
MNIQYNGDSYCKYPGSKITGKERFKKLYHYTSFKTFKKIWEEKRLIFSNVKNVNDPFEVNFSSIIDTIAALPLAFAYDDIKESYKQISFTMRFNSYYNGAMSPMMWGQYGHKGSGVCIEFDYDKLPFNQKMLKGMVEYKDELPVMQITDKLNTKNDVRNFLIAHIKELMFTKYKCWEHENEYRVISSDEESLNIDGAISAVYINRYNRSKIKEIKTLLKDENDISFRYIYIDNINNSGSLIPMEYDIAKMELTRGKNDRIFNKTKSFYEERKSDEGSCLIMKHISL